MPDIGFRAPGEPAEAPMRVLPDPVGQRLRLLLPNVRGFANTLRPGGCMFEAEPGASMGGEVRAWMEAWVRRVEGGRRASPEHAAPLTPLRSVAGGGAMLGYSGWELFWMLLASAAGFVFASYGKRRPDPAALITGIALMLYPYVVDGATGMALIGLGLAGIFTLGRRNLWF